MPWPEQPLASLCMRGGQGRRGLRSGAYPADMQAPVNLQFSWGGGLQGLVVGGAVAGRLIA